MRRANDGIAVAEVLSGGSGTLSGRNGFATLERGEDSVGLGDASVWWTWEAPADGWCRFWLTRQPGDVLAVYRRCADGELERAGASRRLGGSADAVFRVEGGATYLILAVDVVCARSAFSVRLSDGTLRPEEDLNAGGVDRFERDVAEIDVTGGAAASPDGRHLYAGLPRGLLILERTPPP